MSMTADILTPNWNLDVVETGQLRAPLSVVEDSETSKSVAQRDVAGGNGFLSRPTPGRDWAKLIDLVQNAAQHSRDIETKAQEQELRVQELLHRVREDIRRAGEQVRVAEMRARDTQTQAEASILAAEDRARRAEARAQIAEDWLSRVQDAIVNGFAETVAKASSV